MCIYLVIDHRRRQNLEISVTNLAASRDGTTFILRSYHIKGHFWCRWNQVLFDNYPQQKLKINVSQLVIAWDKFPKVILPCLNNSLRKSSNVSSVDQAPDVTEISLHTELAFKLDYSIPTFQRVSRTQGGVITGMPEQMENMIRCN